MGQTNGMLVESKQLEEVCRGRVGGCTGFPLPNGGCRVVALAEVRMLANIIALCGTVQVKKASSKFKVRI